ncbi:MAG: tetratricopeptide repeat protein [Piscinibacter sp.]|uniref:tetratricopeptide repeat protein n=1 Tax=Piscinibacter sp. TaxID=1903157 RepID=UPI002589BFC8|nr:tetratricopeptide repeat protein [Piscinibacter sp.]MCW5666134.1 tetratricopeptide repeat protein [Piscinibacter sp.]
MQQIFISYSSRQRERTRQLAAALEAQYGAGSVWWDEALEARGPYTGQIDAALAAARVVVVVWTAEAACSTWVRAEASAADAAGKLVNVRPPDLPPDTLPAPFNIHQVEEIGATERILRAIDSVMAGRPLPTVIPLHELYERQHRQRLVEPKQCALPADMFDISPSQLLQARYEQVAYLDATGQRDALLRWVLGHPRRAAGRLLHGPGGVGKTRLLIDLAAQLRREHGWMAGFLERVPPQADDAQRRQRRQALRQLVELGTEPGLLLVLDYAEGRREELAELAEWIENRAEPARRPLRLVLLARGAGEWWQRLLEERNEVQALFGERPGWPVTIALPPFDSADQRLALFDAACAAYRPVLLQQGLASPAAEVPEELRARIAHGDRRRRPLSIQMEALVWLAAGAANGGAGGVAGLLDQVLGLERRHWAQVCGALDEAALTELERGLAQLTLVQGVPGRDAADALLERDAYFGSRRREPVDRAPVLSRLSRLYGDSGGGLLPLEPDLLGERLVARVADERLLDACVGWVDAGEDAAPDDAALRSEAAGRRERLVTVLQRATAPEHGAQTQEQVARVADRLLSAHLVRWAPAVVATLVETPGALLERLAGRLSGLAPASLAALDAALPMQTLTLDRIALELAQRRLDLERGAATGADPDRDASLAARLVTLGLRLTATGRFEEALAATDEAVQMCRRVAQARPDEFLPDLAGSLNNLGNWLSALGRREEALAATEEALQIRRHLARTRPDTFLPDLAMGLNNLGRDLADLGRREDALAATGEAVQVWRGLAQAWPETFLPDLAKSLGNLGIGLSGLGRLEDALAATDEALQIHRRLAQTRSDTYLPDLAKSLNYFGNRLFELGRREDALAATDEALQIYRRLAQARPDAFLSDLAGSLNNLGIRLSELGRREDALAAIDEAVQIYRRLAQTRTDTYLPDLAMSLNNLGNGLSDLGRREEALAAIEEAVQIRRRLALARPDAFGPDLATSLGAHSMALAGAGRSAAAAASAEEGLGLLLPLLERYPAAFGKLADALASDHRLHAEAAAQAPNTELLARVEALRGRDQEGDASASAGS